MAQAGNYLRGVQEAGGPVFQVGGRGPPGSEVQPGQDPQVNEEHQSPPTPCYSLLQSNLKTRAGACVLCVPITIVPVFTFESTLVAELIKETLNALPSRVVLSHAKPTQQWN